KLYFMIGLPGETDVDVVGIAETVRWLRRECFIKGRRALKFNITISNLTPKPHTPFQWHSVSTEEFKRKQKLLQEEFRSIRGVKANFTDVRISAMENFVGRGDRRLSAVVRRAWELGAGMDAWWESLENAFGAWTQAIADAGLDWQYRQVESGEWSLDENIPTAEQAGQAVTDAMTAVLDRPLPWDHIDTGIEKRWLQEDLHKALAAAVVPDCSFEGCSHCGICGPDFGHNIVVAPPKIPEFVGHFEPNQTRAQRIRLEVGKLGDMALIGHLDFARLMDRAIRRAALPIAFTGGFHPGPRISPANALPLGITSTGELIDFELTKELSVEAFRTQLQEQLPEDVPIYSAKEISLQMPSATKSLDKAVYFLALNAEAKTASAERWVGWVEQVSAADHIMHTKTTKSGKQKEVDLRSRLFELDIVSPAGLTELPPAVKNRLIETGQCVVRYVGSCRNDGTLLRPQGVLTMLETVSGQSLALGHIHRQKLILTA
ncbi:MAG: TIGR03936 family radical SAM-associated protein, partial [Phormidesmis sp.]